MTEGMKDQLKGTVFLLIVAGIPLSLIFTPMVILPLFAGGAVWGIVRESIASTSTPRKRAKTQARRSDLSKADEELITAILPVINRNK